MSNEPIIHDRALSVRQPWAWSIINAGKDVENRSRVFGIRGRVYIHASAGTTFDEYSCAARMIRERGIVLPEPLPPFDMQDRGGIIGSVEIVGVVRASDSPWFVGPSAYILRNPRPLPFTPCKGALSFWRVPADVLAQLREHEEATA